MHTSTRAVPYISIDSIIIVFKRRALLIVGLCRAAMVNTTVDTVLNRFFILGSLFRRSALRAKGWDRRTITARNYGSYRRWSRRTPYMASNNVQG